MFLQIIFKPVDIEKEYDTIYIGNRLPWKGCPYIDSVVRELQTDHLWVGEGPYEPQYGDVTGYGVFTELPKYYNKAKIGIHFSLETRTWKEQFNYVSNEALSCGLPVIVEDTKIMRELFSGCEAVNFVEEGNVKELREKIGELLNLNPEEREDLGRKGREFVENNYSNTVQVDKLLKKSKR